MIWPLAKRLKEMSNMMHDIPTTHKRCAICHWRNGGRKLVVVCVNP